MNFKTNLLVLILLVPMLSETIFLQEKHLVWFNLTSSTIGDLFNTMLSYPKLGYATYFQTTSHQLLSQQYTLEKKYFNFYQTSSQLIRTNTMFCQGNQTLSICQSINKVNLCTDETSQKQSIAGSLSIFQDEKRLLTNKGYLLVFYQRSQQKQFLQFLFVVVISILLIVFQFKFKQIKYLEGKFFLQLMTLCSMFVYESCELVKEAIQSWHEKNHQFWLFLPLSLISYKIIESLAQRFMYNTIPMITWLQCISMNYFLIYFAQQSTLFDFFSYAMIMCCQIQNQNENQHTQSFKANKKKVERNISTAYMMLNFGLIFKKQWTYCCIYIAPLYFIIKVTVLLSFFAVYLRESRENQRREHMIAVQFKIKIIQTQNELIEELSLDQGSSIQQECSICYEKIVCRWAKTPCGHVFHDDCLYKWLSKSQTCPIDRRRAISDKNPVLGKRAQVLNE